MSRHICHLCCDCAMAPESLPLLPCLAAQLQGSVSGERSSWHCPSLAGGLAPISYPPYRCAMRTHAHTDTVAERHTFAHGSFCTLSFNQALSWASVTALSTRRVKDLSPQVTSLTDPLTDRTLAHLDADVTTISAWSKKSV